MAQDPNHQEGQPTTVAASEFLQTLLARSGVPEEKWSPAVKAMPEIYIPAEVVTEFDKKFVTIDEAGKRDDIASVHRKNIGSQVEVALVEGLKGLGATDEDLKDVGSAQSLTDKAMAAIETAKKKMLASQGEEVKNAQRIFEIEKNSIVIREQDALKRVHEVENLLIQHKVADRLKSFKTTLTGKDEANMAMLRGLLGDRLNADGAEIKRVNNDLALFRRGTNEPLVNPKNSMPWPMNDYLSTALLDAGILKTSETTTTTPQYTLPATVQDANAADDATKRFRQFMQTMPTAN